MTTRSPRVRAAPNTWSAPVFPQPVSGFAGRRSEIDRALRHVDRDNLFFIYGVAGIGKTELAYQLIREIGALPQWADAIPLLVDARPGLTAPRILAQLLAAVGSSPVPRRGQPTEQAHLTEQLERLARALDERPHLLFIDDVHNLPHEPVAEALCYLSRRVRNSRLVVASRREILLPPDAPPPVITTLGPLDAADAEAMMTALADRIQVPRPEPASMLRSTHGSPFHIHAMLVRRAPDSSALEASLAELTPHARRLLMAAATAQHRPSVAQLQVLSPGAPPIDDAIRDLEQQFLIERKQGQVVVHDLIREALLGRSADDERAAAHRDAAALCLAELAERNDPPLFLTVDAVNHCIAAGEPDDAWALVERWQSQLAAAGSEHLLLEPLEQLRTALPARRIPIDLLIARCLVRASLFEEAGHVLARVGDDRSPAEETRFCVLAGELAQQAGQVECAMDLFERAAERAPDADARFQAQLRRGILAIFAEGGERGRELLAAAVDELPSPSPSQLARAGWARTMSWMVDERYERAGLEAFKARRELPANGLEDLGSQLAMLETLAFIECQQMDRARAAAACIDESGLRQRSAAMCRAIVDFADGNARDASCELVETHDYMRSHGDAGVAYVAGYYGSIALGEIGRLCEAQVLAESASQLGKRAGMHGPAARSIAQQALFAAEAIQHATAHRLADEALASPTLGPRSRANAHLAHAHAYTIGGDITRALQHIAHARAAVADPELTVSHAAIEIEHAAIDLIAGNLDGAVERAERACDQFHKRSRDFEIARGRLVLAAAYIARGRRTDLVLAERSQAKAQELANRGSMQAIQVGCAILSAALARKSNRDRAARELLEDALRELGPERGSLYANVLLAAIDGGAIARAAPGAVALLAHLGFSETVDCYLIDQHGRRAATDGDVARERELRELFVDEIRSVIVARRGELEIGGRSMLCGLLSALVQARGEPIAAEALYKRVWGVPEYHPLQHRNALYVALNRLRGCLKEAFPGRDLIQRTKPGWRLVDGIDACVAVAVHKPAGVGHDAANNR